MIFEEGPDFNLTTHDHNLLDWSEDSISYIPSFLDDPYTLPDAIAGCECWPQDQEEANLIHSPPSTTPVVAPPTTSPPSLPQPEFSKKRKLPTSSTTLDKAAAHQNRRRTVADSGDEDDGVSEEDGEITRKQGNGRKGERKGNGGNSGSGNKEVRWAEHLLNPCATAIEAANLSRVYHLLYVLQELACTSGDANHRLAAYGLRALTRHLSSAGIAAAAAGVPGQGGGPADDSPSFASTEPKLFRSALIKFHEVSPWFALPNSLANASILQAVTLDSSNQRPRPLHVVDVGVSHGIQWPTLLDALSRRPGGAPALVRITVAGAAAPPGPFSAAPPGYDFSSHLLRYANSIDLNLRIDRADTLAPRSLSLARRETLVVCAQFRVGHGGPEDRTAFLRSVRELNPDLVVLGEVDGAGESDDRFPAEFGRRAELLWKFLDSTSAAFKGRDCAERRVVEGEAARVLEWGAAAAEGCERWRERMVGLGFREERFGEEAVEAGRALLRKYDGNWETRMAGAAVGLGWKGQRVSFCSLWKPHTRSQ
ncbi:protein NODULATION SIGNALING PATHWAY 1-like [Phoenix dactylifera]|uniref:Protein NODULATION SIGNALING PATHWAY 1-like n=1 Tax=Phoenix dactylifera TaxID=42345 RepID=A0A8B7CMR2_PHODC|nr:protein NODULATION SIGNALING PATHWAY 1-like [Phoenix dactylifera]